MASPGDRGGEEGEELGDSCPRLKGTKGVKQPLKSKRVKPNRPKGKNGESCEKRTRRRSGNELIITAHVGPGQMRTHSLLDQNTRQQSHARTCTS